MKISNSSFINKIFFYNSIFFLANLIFFLIFPKIDITISSFFFYKGTFIHNHFPFISELRTFLKNLMVFIGFTSLLYLISLKINSLQKILIIKKKVRSKLIAFGLLFGPLVGCGLIANLYFKDSWGRARPYQIEEFGGKLLYSAPLIKSNQCSKNCSRIGGETSAAFSFIAGILFLKRRIFFFKIICMFGFFVIFCRMAMGGHFLSDNLFAINIMIYLSLIYYFTLIKFIKKTK